MPKLYLYVFETPAPYRQKHPQRPVLVVFYAPSQKEAVRYFKDCYSDLGYGDLEGNPVLVERRPW